jgi:MFS family permease
MSDRFGRKPVFLVAASIYILMSILVTIAPSIYFIYLCLFTMGSVGLARASASYMMTNEFAPVANQQTYFDGCSSLIIPAIIGTTKVYYYHSIFAYSSFIIIVIIVFLYIPESPHYLYSKKDYKGLRSCLMRIARTNIGHDKAT